MKGKGYINIKDDSPGPIYNTCTSRDKVLTRFPKFSIGNSKRNLEMNRTQLNNPGPGSYELDIKSKYNNRIQDLIK
jgi:hypothetical protein